MGKKSNGDSIKCEWGVGVKQIIKSLLFYVISVTIAKGAVVSLVAAHARKGWIRFLFCDLKTHDCISLNCMQ